MQLLENKYEKAGLLLLPPNARDVAEHLLTVMPLEKLLQMQQENQPDINLLKDFNVPKTLWLDILNATLLAKSTYFIINPKLCTEEIMYLMKVACNSIDRPLNIYSIKEVIEMSRDDYPIFTEWLAELGRLLKSKALKTTNKA